MSNQSETPAADDTDLAPEQAAEVESITEAISQLLEGKDVRVGFVALFSTIDGVAQQSDPEIRAHCVQYLRQLAGELEAMDAPKH